jgi:hypothetical protein
MFDNQVFVITPLILEKLLGEIQPHLPFQKYYKNACHELLSYVRRGLNITSGISFLHLPKDRCGLQSNLGTCQAPFVIDHLPSKMKIQHLQRPKYFLQP